jgi:hypothetical protein
MGRVSSRSMFIVSVIAFTTLLTLPAVFHERTRHGVMSLASNFGLQQPLCTSTPAETWPNESPSESLDLALVPQRRRNIAVASVFGAHFDVYMALVWTLEKVIDADRPFGATGTMPSVQVYAPEFYYGFEDVVETLGLYHGDIFRPDRLVEDVQKGHIDLIVLGTCEIE